MSTVSSVFSNSAIGVDGQVAARTHKSALGQDDFLKLLVTKMSSQDPMNPQADTDFIAQMAQFSSLEQTKSMSSDIAMLKNQQQVLTANGLIGRTVTVTEGAKQLAQGVVSSIAVQDGAPQVVVGGHNYDLDLVSNISPILAIA